MISKPYIIDRADKKSLSCADCKCTHQVNCETIDHCKPIEEDHFFLDHCYNGNKKPWEEIVWVNKS